jgi:hypothetical protein
VYLLGMGLLDRAFGADKNSLLFKGLAFHWVMVASHHENFLKKNELNAEQVDIFREIQKQSLEMADLANSSLKGFGVSTPDTAAFLKKLEQLSKLQTQVTVVTDKRHWLPEAMTFTKMILGGEKRRFQKSQYWFSD